MSDNQRHRRWEPNPIWFAVDSATVVEIGDLGFLDTNDFKPASSFTWDTDLATTQKAFALAFAGMSADRSGSGDTDDIAVDSMGVKEFTCASATFEAGDLVGPADSGSNTLENQKVVAVASLDLAIGIVYRREASAVTSVNVVLLPYILKMVMNSTDVIAMLQSPAAGSRIDADYIDDGSTNKIVPASILTAIKGVYGPSTTQLAVGVEDTATSDEATATLINIDTGFGTGVTPSGANVTILRSGVRINSDEVITMQADGIVRVANGSTYTVTAGDVFMVWAWV